MAFWDDVGNFLEDAVTNGGATKRKAFKKAFAGVHNTPPPRPPDLTDEVIWAAQRAEMLRQRTGRTRQSTFLTQPTSLLGG